MQRKIQANHRLHAYYYFVLRPFLIMGIVLLPCSYAGAQKSIFEDMNFGIKFGASSLLTEMPTNFSGGIREFDNQAGITFDLEISRAFATRWELGIEINSSLLRGKNNTPSFSAQGFHEAFQNPVVEPVEYNNRLLGPKIFFRYYFKIPDNKNEKVYLNPYLRFGAGFVEYKAYFKYIDAPDDKILFGKNSHNYHTRLSNAVYTLGAGIKTNLSPTFFVVLAFDVNVVPYDFLDVVHNYTPEGNRQNILGWYSELKIGIFYRNHAKARALRQRHAPKEYLPFGR